MRIKILVVATLSLLVVSCGKSDEAAKVTAVSNGVSDVQVATPGETPAAVESVKTAVEAVTAGTQAPVQAGTAAGGEAVYRKACISCHMNGAAGAPKVGDASAWKARIDKGAAALVQSAITGVPGTAMIVRGACATCSDEDIKAAVDYMVAQSR